MEADTTLVSRMAWLAHPPDRVFTEAMRPEIAPLIDPGVRRWEPDRRPTGIGTKFAIVGRFQWLPVRGCRTSRSGPARYDRAHGALDRNPTYIVATYVAGATGAR